MTIMGSGFDGVRWSMRRVTLVVVAMLVWAEPVFAQLDPLLFLKANQPNVLLVVDVASRMQRGAPTDPSTLATSQATSDYYDPYIYPLDLAKTWQTGSLLLSADNTTASYRRKYNSLTYATGGSDKFNASTIAITHDRDAGYATFEAPTRLSVARASLYQAITENQNVAKFSLIKMRQSSPTIVTSPGGNAGPVADVDSTQQNPTDWTPSDSGRWAISRPSVSGNNGSANSSTAVVVAADAANANTTILTTLAKDTRTAGGLLPVGNDDGNTVDTPVNNMLVDAKAEAARLIGADTKCANTVVVLVVGGGEGTTGGATNATLATTASGFVNVASGRRVPIYVVAIAPSLADVLSLQAIATNSGGQYFEITRDQINAAVCQSGSSPSCVASPIQTAAATGAPAGTVVVPEVVKAVNTAIQHAFASYADVNAAPTASPFGPLSEFQTTSPIIGTVDLAGAKDITGSALTPDPATVKDKADNVIPQRSNLLITSGFTLPGFDAQIRGFRVYKAQADSTQPSGWKFLADGTRLWIACAPGTVATGPCSSLSTNTRNLYTAGPDGSMIAFTTANAATLATHMNLNEADATAVIAAVRSLPIGATIDSTPLIMNPPSLDPPPDDTYPAFAVANKDRRSIIFVGTNRGILEAIDARLGMEVWGFIPYNLLPKLRTLLDGQPVGNFDFFMDGSPKVSDVRLADGTWHTYLFAGEGPGGTFYQALDVTLTGMASSVSPTDDSISPALTHFASSAVIPLKWTFPLYTNFDPTLSAYQPYSPTPTLKPYGDIKASASTLEKTVGQTWSDPAVGQVQTNASPYVLLVGSGFLPYSTQHLQANRGDTVAGTTFYVFNVNDGTVLASKDVGSDGVVETLDNCVATNDCTKFKNALQSDPVATGPSDSRFITKAYMGDLDGRIWRFDLSLSGSNVTIPSNATKLYDDPAKQPFFSSMATVNVGGTQQYIFSGTGNDLLPSKGVSLQYRLLGVLDNGASGTKTFEIDLVKVDGVAGDEKVTAFPAVAGDIVFFTTTTFNPATPCTAPSASLYAVTFIGGPAYDTNNDGTFDRRDSTLVKTVAGTRASAPFIVDQHLVFTTGNQIQMFGDPQDFNNGIGQAGVRILSWREVR